MKKYGKTIQLKISGMSCAGCASAVEQALSKVAGVKEVQISLETGLATANIIPGDMNTDNLIDAVKMAGYEASVAD